MRKNDYVGLGLGGVLNRVGSAASWQESVKAEVNVAHVRYW